MDPLTFLGAFVAIALILVLLGKAKDWETAEYRKHGVQTQGIVLHNELCWGHNSVMRPVVRFTTQQGKVIEALDESGIAFAVPRFSSGDKILLIYQKSNPLDFRILSQGRFA